MSIPTTNKDSNQISMPSKDMSNYVFIDDAVDMAVLTSFDKVHVDGETDLVVELIDLYLEDVPSSLRAMREAMELGDIHSLRSAAHNLKGSSSSLGAANLAALCDVLEVNVNGPSTQRLDTSLTSVEHEFERVRLAFEDERNRRRSSTLNEGSP